MIGGNARSDGSFDLVGRTGINVHATFVKNTQDGCMGIRFHRVASGLAESGGEGHGGGRIGAQDIFVIDKQGASELYLNLARLLRLEKC